VAGEFEGRCSQIQRSKVLSPFRMQKGVREK
jgi:hypothetical protein